MTARIAEWLRNGVARNENSVMAIHKCTEMEQKYIIIWMHQYILIYCRLLRGGGGEVLGIFFAAQRQEVDFSLGSEWSVS